MINVPTKLIFSCQVTFEREFFTPFTPMDREKAFERGIYKNFFNFFLAPSMDSLTDLSETPSNAAIFRKVMPLK